MINYKIPSIHNYTLKCTNEMWLEKSVLSYILISEINSKKKGKGTGTIDTNNGKTIK